MEHLDILFWAIAIVVFLGVESMTTALVSIWFALCSVFAFFSALLNASILIQAIVFFVVSVLALVFTWPLTRKYVQCKLIPTNADRVIGQVCKVTETIDNENSKGAVYADGKSWSARSEDGSIIQEGSLVEIKKISGVKVFVTKHNKEEM